jgi:hypothetical protein
MPDRSEHIGLPLLSAEREKLLGEYEIALKQVADDPVKVDHGNIGEAALRNFFVRFLPKKYGVTKGHIITPDRDYAGPLEEWDIIIYDAMEAPVLFVRRTADDMENAGRRGIPVEYVRGVVEVKATFNKASARHATDKLLKLRQFLEQRATRTRLGRGEASFHTAFEPHRYTSKPRSRTPKSIPMHSANLANSGRRIRWSSSSAR